MWSKYIAINAEKFRDKIVKHKGKKKLLIEDREGYPKTPELILKYIDMYIDLITQDNNTSIDWMKSVFSTSIPEDLFVRKVAILASQKKFYSYDFMPMCWLPKINFTGTDEDWTNLYNSVSQMPTFDDDMENWKGKLISFIDHCINNEDEDFWQTPLIESVKAGSGRIEHYTGWITLFNPFYENGQWGHSNGSWYKIKSDSVLKMAVDFTINCFDLSGTIKVAEVDVIAGPTNYKLSDGGIKIANIADFKYKKL